MLIVYMKVQERESRYMRGIVFADLSFTIVLEQDP